MSMHFMAGREIGAILLPFALTASSPSPQTTAVKEELRHATLILAAPEAGNPKTLIVLVERDPWLMVIGSDSPSFALYDDGEAIYWTKTGYKSVKLDKADLARLIGRLDLGTLACLDEYYDAASATDQPTEVLTIFNGDKRSSVSVYGSMKSTSVRSKTPKAFITSYDILHAFQRPDARDWLPEKVEVMVWPYAYAPEASIVWPKGWPALDDPGTVKRGDSYSIFLPSSDYPALTSFLRDRKEKGAVEIGGKKWAVSTRFPFAGEKGWMRSRSKDAAASACPNPRR
jgi:hypothetical protein